MKIKNSKRTIIASIIAIVISFSILIGVTFAWFTDSASTGPNKIQSGNLDVSLLYTDPYSGAAEEVDENTRVFLNVDGNPILWEPGAKASGKFEVKNNGTLALKYQFGIVHANATETPTGKTLADALGVYATVKAKNTGSDLVMGDANLEALQVGSAVPGYDITAMPLLKDGFVVEALLLPGESISYEIGVYWEPTDNDNEFNVENGLLIDFAVALVATQANYENDGEGSFYDSNANFPGFPVIPADKLDSSWYEDGGKYLPILSSPFKMLNDPSTTMQIVDGEIVVAKDGAYQGTLPEENVTIEGDVITISGMGEQDGVYTIHRSGYVDKDGEIIAKSEETWVEADPALYLIVHDGVVYASYDGNTLLVEDGQEEPQPVVDLDAMGDSVNAFIEENEVDLDAFYQAYGYRLEEYEEGEYKVGNLFDALAVSNIVEEGEAHFGIYTGRYNYWGGTAKDIKTDDELITQANWSETDLDAVITTSVYLITEDGKKKLSTSDEVVGGTIEIVQETKYYHDGVETENVMFFEDYALYFEDGMTYREWMHTYHVFQLHDICNGMHEHNGIYIPEQYLDNLCEPGYRSELQSPPEKMMSDYLGYFTENGEWIQEYVYYSYGKSYIKPSNFNEEGYEYLGMSWEGGLQADGTIYVEEYYNYFLRDGKTPEVLPFNAGFKVATGIDVVDISSFLSFDSSNNIVVDLAGLKEACQIADDANVSVIPVFERDGYLVDCRSIGGNYNEEIGVTYYEANKVSLASTIYCDGATGITFYYNGVVYTGFVA